MSLNFFLCSLSLFSYHNEKQKNGDNPFTFSGCVFHFKCRPFFLPSLPACQAFFTCNVVQSLLSMRNWKNPPVALAVPRQTHGASRSLFETQLGAYWVCGRGRVTHPFGLGLSISVWEPQQLPRGSSLGTKWMDLHKASVLRVSPNPSCV